MGGHSKDPYLAAQRLSSRIQQYIRSLEDRGRKDLIDAICRTFGVSEEIAIAQVKKSTTKASGSEKNKTRGIIKWMKDTFLQSKILSG